MKSTHKKTKQKKKESVLLVWRLHTEFGLKSRFFWQLLLDYKIVFGWKKKPSTVNISLLAYIKRKSVI